VSIHACTIIARNYLPAARVLAASFERHHPGERFTVLVIDGHVTGQPSAGQPSAGQPSDVMGEPFEILGLDDIGLAPGELEKMAAIYDVMELSTAVKPWLLSTLLAGSPRNPHSPVSPSGSTGGGAPGDAGSYVPDCVAYLDPDIAVYAPLVEIERLATEQQIVLTPHVTAPVPRDGKSVTESDLLASGMYNLGFIALGQGPTATAFLDFWKARLARDCVVDPTAMRFVDQRWVDFVPGAFGAAILRDPSYNVAYWNLDHRPVTRSGDSYFVDGEPLHFFHFSGYRPSMPWLLSRHQGARPRIVLSEHPELAALCGEYGRALVAAGYDEWMSTPYGFATLANDLPYDPVMRALYRSALAAHEQAALTGSAGLGPSSLPEPPNPLVEGGADAFLYWLNALPDDRPDGKVTRYLTALHRSRVDLQAAFGDIDGAGFALFAEWSQHEVGQGRLDGRLAIPANIALDAKRAAASGRVQRRVLQPGIRVAGYLSAETGVGELGRLAAMTIAAAGIPSATYLDRHSVSRQHDTFLAGGPSGSAAGGPSGSAASGASNLDVNLICVNADELPNFAARVGPGFFEGRYTIGLWAWELEELPRRYEGSFAHLDEVWGISDFTRDAIRAISPIPTYSFPLPIVAPVPAPGIGRAALGLPDGYVFLFCFDMMSIVERKNPFGLIEAFSRAFAPGEGPTLVIKAVGTALRQPELEHLKWVAAKRPDIVIIDRYLEAGVNRALMASCDCYVSLHRSEGFGLTLGEAMALGKPVIATGYSANLGFMSEETSYLVPWTPGSVPVALDPYPHGARWAEPDLDVAARLMREVYAHPEAASAKGAKAKADVLGRHGVAARAAFVSERYACARSVIASRTPRTSLRELSGRAKQALRW